jgi:hypothetical protein
LAGLAFEFGQLRKSDEYLSGIWKSKLLHQLVWWQVISHRDLALPFPIVSPDWSIIPSWSWASIGAPVQWYETRLESERNQELCSVSLQASDMHYYTLRITGVPMKPRSPKDVHSMSATFSSRNCPKKPVAIFRHLGMICNYELDSWYLHQLWDHAFGDRDSFIDSLVKSTVILPVIWDSEYDCPDPRAQCLLLWRDPGFGRGVYRRVGYVKMKQADGHQYPVREALIETAKKYAKRLPTDYFVNRRHDGTCQIDLI